MAVPERQPVRLGEHCGASVFATAVGLHEPVMGLAVIGVGRDPEVMFEEHGVGQVCNYFEAHPAATLNPELGPRGVLPLQRRAELAERVNSDDPKVQFHAMASAFGLEDADVVNVMLASVRESLAERGGSLWIVQCKRRFQRRRAMVRVLHSAQAQTDRPMDSLVSEPQPLEEHAAGSESFIAHFFEPLVLLASPWTLGLVASRAVPEASETYALLMNLGPGHGALLADPEAVEWTRVFGSSHMYRNASLDGFDFVAGQNVAFAQLDFSQLVPWWTERLNVLLTEITDLGRYRDADGVFNARAAYREARTLDRLLVTATRIQLHPYEHVLRVSAAFEIFDLLPELVDATPGARDTWNALLDPARSLAIIDEAFAEAPGDIARAFITKTQEIVRHIGREARACVVPGRDAGNDGIRVADALMPMTEYQGRIFQALRDTHHGYELTAQWKREVLDTYTGHIPVGFPELALLYVFAFIASPQEARAGSWFT